MGRLEAELRAARAALDAAESERSAAIEVVAAAEDEVRACTGPSWRALRNLVTGRYRSSRDAAREVAAQARARSSAADDAVRARRLLADRLQAGLTAAIDRARRAHDEWEAERTADVLRAGGPLASELQEIDASLTTSEAEQRELREATAAVQSARAAAGRALEKLDSASSWGTYDTWFGGDIISSSIKHSRIDDARATMNAVQTQLAAARRELADVGMDISAPDLARVSEGRTLDIWFDNFFSDLSSQSRIGDGRAKVQQLVRELSAAAGRLQERTREVAATVATLRARRTAILEQA
ncbi:MAG: hypothetical protein U0R68_02805 [Candidatus Nanopelagicales bacterium]